MYDFVVIGDIMVDRIITLTDPDVINSFSAQEHKISLPFPSKMRLEVPPETQAGGNAYNTAYTMRKLGLEVALYTVVGTDYAGQKMLERIKDLGVNCDLVQTDQVNETNSAVILNVASDRLVLGYHFNRTYRLPEIPETKYVYLTSVGEDDSALFKQVVEQKQQKGFKLIFSPGTLQVTESFTDIKEVMLHTDILILNKEEALKVSRLNTDSNEYLLRGLHNFGPKLVIMTRSDHGSIAFDGKDFTKVGALQVEVVESTGAGDCYAATVGTGLLLEKDLPTAMGWGAVHAANSILTVGATTGILDRGELEKKYSESIDMLKYTEASDADVEIPKPTEHYGEPS